MHLTHIEITPEMVNAGCNRYSDLTFHEACAEAIVTEVFRAMMRARGGSLTPKMIDAGLNELVMYEPGWDVGSDVVRDIYVAMEKARLGTSDE